MVTHPDQWVDEFAKAGASMFTFHVEACSDPLALVRRIRAAGKSIEFIFMLWKNMVLIICYIPTMQA